jgi:rubredoxin
MSDEPYRKYQCGTCGFIYDEQLGLPSEGFPPGTRFADIHAGWNCPDCGMSKDQFELLEDE